MVEERKKRNERNDEGGKIQEIGRKEEGKKIEERQRKERDRIKEKGGG